jgi:hypothetical protein
MGCIAKNDICCICGKRIGTKEKYSYYVINYGYMHELCHEKYKKEEVVEEIEEKEGN